ncbi:MAG: response regulator, partial [Elusimicrobia bacterium]|nr:response regulator [Elusimicrobiota bacterium]
RLKKLYPAMRIVYMSGYPGDARTNAFDVGDSAFLEKPFSPAKLLGALRQVLDSRPGDAP